MTLYLSFCLEYHSANQPATLFVRACCRAGYDEKSTSYCPARGFQVKLEGKITRGKRNNRLLWA